MNFDLGSISINSEVLNVNLIRYHKMKSLMLILLFTCLTVLPKKVYSQNTNLGVSSELESILKDPKAKGLKKSSRRILKETKPKHYNDRQILEDYLVEGDSVKSFKKDSLANDRLLQMGEETLDKELGNTEQVKDFQELVNESENPFDNPAFEKDALAEGTSNIKNLPSQFGIKHFEGKESEILAAMAQVQDLKKKYRYVPDSENLDNALKQNSLKDAGFRERIEWEGNFNIQWGKPFVMDFGPSLGYKFSKIFSGGLSGVVRMNIRDKNSADFSNVGYRIYARYGVFHSFFVHGEYETVFGKFKPKEQSISSIQSLQSLNVGLGKKFNIARGIKGRLVVLYNIPLDNHEHYKSPWIFRMGIGR